MPVAKVASEERDADDRRTDYNFYHKMYCIAREIVFFMAITFTTYAALQNTPPKISKGPPPVPFFAQNSLVTDFYSGQLASAFGRISESDVSFVMYYAPWDAESQAVRSHFSNVARFYRKQVKTYGRESVKRFGQLLTSRSSEPMRVIEVSMEQRQNEEVGKQEVPEKIR